MQLFRAEIWVRSLGLGLIGWRSFFYFSRINLTVIITMPWEYFPAVWYAFKYLLLENNVLFIKIQHRGYVFLKKLECSWKKFKMFLKVLEEIWQPCVFSLSLIYRDGTFPYLNGNPYSGLPVGWNCGGKNKLLNKKNCIKIG